MRLYTRANELADAEIVVEQFADMSMSEIPDSGSNFELTQKPTPGSVNQIAPSQYGSLSFSPVSGYYKGTVLVFITVNISNAKIRYTLDGSTVQSTSQLYTSPINIYSTKILRARGYVGNTPVTNDVSQFYAIDYTGSLPVLSLATDESNLTGNSGIFTNFDGKGKDWEVPVAVNLLEFDNGGFQINAGMRVHGQSSRKLPKKSMRLYFRKSYGKSRLEYKMYPHLDLADFNCLVVHAGGSEDQPTGGRNVWTLLRDPLAQALHSEVNGHISAYRLVLLYLNGKFWGIYHIRERIDPDYLANHFGFSDVDLLKWYNQEVPDVQAGDLNHWEETCNFFKNHSMVNDEHYRRVQELIEIRSFTDYQIIEIYAGNNDWPHRNVYVFCERNPAAKWQWILWDAETTFKDPKANDLEWATRDRVRTDLSLSDCKEQLFGTLLLRRLLENEDYQRYFITRFTDLLNVTLQSHHVRTVFDQLVGNIGADVPAEAIRWGVPVSEFDHGVTEIRAFIDQRPRYLRYQIQNYFHLCDLSELTLNTDYPDGGTIRINSLELVSLPWSGYYFNGIPIEIEAIPKPGFIFTGWSDAALPNEPLVNLNLKGDFSLSAHFAPSAPSIRRIFSTVVNTVG